MKHGTVEEETQECAALYALGALSQHEARAFDEHLAEGCETCEAELKGFEAVVSTLVYDACEATPPAAAREKLLARLAETGDARPSSAAAQPAQDDTSQTVIVRAGEGEWQVMSEGVLFKQLFADPTRNTVTTLVRMQPGSRIPKHRHRGIEECYVIEGDAFTNNETLKAGDYTCAMAGSVHHPISSVNGALLLLVSPESYEVLEQ
jgi:predicted ChrR family anti-sigma factor